MHPLYARIAPVLHLARITTAFAAVGNVWFVILWTKAHPDTEPGTRMLDELPLWASLGAGATTAIGLFAFGVSLNDLLDVRRDRTTRPERPLASGRLSRESAILIVVSTMLVAVLGAAILGRLSTLLTLVLLAAITVYNAVGKFIPSVGMVMLGLIYAGHMLVGNPELRFLWPVWLVMTHALVVAGAQHWVGRKVPPISRRAIGGAVLGWAFWSSALMWVANRRGVWPWADWVPALAPVAPLVLAGLCALWCTRRVRATGTGAKASEKIARYGALWLPLYGAAWLFGADRPGAGWILAGVAAGGIAGMTLLREWFSLLEQPVGYRR